MIKRWANNIKNNDLKYAGGITKCPRCGSTTLSTGADIDKKNNKILRWYHRCIECGKKIYFKEDTQCSKGKK